MKKPLTKEEFLERKNSQIHRELLAVFKAKQDNDTISRWFQQFFKDNPKLGLCQFMGQPNVVFDVTYNYQAVFINMCLAIKDGELFRLYKGEGKTQVIISHDEVEKASDNLINLDHLK